jgi:4-hydroxybutyrate CoA-transferase
MEPKKIDPGEAAEMIHTGQRVALGPVCGEPQTLVRAMVARKDRLENVEIYTTMPLGECLYALPEMAGHFKIKAFSIGPGLVDAVTRGQADYIPCHLSDIPKFFSERTIQADVALIQLSPPDHHGYCSLGVSVTYLRQVIDQTKVVIAEINEQMPRTIGDTLVHLSELDYVVEASHPLPDIRKAEGDEVEKKIAELISEMIPDGAVLQIGIGNIPEAILREMKGKKSLSIHTGMFSDGILDLWESGAFETRKGESKGGRIVSTAIIGTSKLYEFCHNNSLVELRGIDYTHDFNVLSRIRGLISINSAVQMDLNGQVNAEMAGGKLISGVGGQLDFIRGTAASPGGKSVIAFPSSAKNGKISRIVSKLDAGISVAVGRADIDYVVTEYGMARLRGKSLPERAKELIAIAHPNFREELKQASQKINR